MSHHNEGTLRRHRNEGLYGFYRGLVPGTVRVLPATWITFVVYEEMSHLFRKHAS